MTEKTPSETKSLEVLVTRAVEKIDSGAMTIADLLKALSPHQSDATHPVPAAPPVPVTISDSQRKALARVVEVFGKVVPTERRALQPVEVDSLIEEKEVLDEVKKMATKRHESIRTTIYNHLDVEAEAADDFDPEATPRDKDGHYVLDGIAVGTGSTGAKFARETREGNPTLDVEGLLKELADDPDYPDFTHKDYLAMTSQVRVLDENKVMLALKKKPGLVMAIAKATKPGTKSSALNLRKI